ncbi:unnamed protein product [Closterium sp. NIES-53]
MEARAVCFHVEPTGLNSVQHRSASVRRISWARSSTLFSLRHNRYRERRESITRVFASSSTPPDFSARSSSGDFKSSNSGKTRGESNRGDNADGSTKDQHDDPKPSTPLNPPSVGPTPSVSKSSPSSQPSSPAANPPSAPSVGQSGSASSNPSAFSSRPQSSKQDQIPRPGKSGPGQGGVVKTSTQYRSVDDGSMKQYNRSSNGGAANFPVAVVGSAIPPSRPFSNPPPFRPPPSPVAGIEMQLRQQQEQGQRPKPAMDSEWINFMSPDWYPVKPIWQGTEQCVLEQKDLLLSLPRLWRMMLLSDGSVTRHLELLLGEQVTVDCVEMRGIGHALLGLPPGTALVPGPRVQRQVHLKPPSGEVLVYAASWWAAEEVKTALPAVQQPVWKTLQQQRTELFRSLERLYYGSSPHLERIFGVPGPFWARHYFFYSHGRPLTLIYEAFSPRLDARVTLPGFSKRASFRLRSLGNVAACNPTRGADAADAAGSGSPEADFRRFSARWSAAVPCRQQHGRPLLASTRSRRCCCRHRALAHHQGEVPAAALRPRAGGWVLGKAGIRAGGWVLGKAGIRAAGLLSRTLIVPFHHSEVVRNYNMHVALDVEHLRRCFGKVVFTTAEYRRKYVKPINVTEVVCWHGPKGACREEDKELLLNCPAPETMNTPASVLVGGDGEALRKICTFRYQICILRVLICIPRIQICTPRDQICPPRDQICIPRIQICTQRDQICIPRFQICALRAQICIPRDQICTFRAQIHSSRARICHRAALLVPTHSSIISGICSDANSSTLPPASPITSLPPPPPPPSPTFRSSLPPPILPAAGPAAAQAAGPAAAPAAALAAGPAAAPAAGPAAAPAAGPAAIPAFYTSLSEDSHEEFLDLHLCNPSLLPITFDLFGTPVFAFSSAPSIFIPTMYAVAMACPDAPLWLAAIIKELDAFIANSSFVDVPRPPASTNMVKGKWVFRVKQLLGESSVYKARYCAKGFTQWYAVDFFDTFSPTAKPATVRAVLDLAARLNIEIHSMDVSNAFLQGVLRELIYMERPAGFHLPFPANSVWQLRRPVYGLRQAPREWHAKLAANSPPSSRKLHRSHPPGKSPP